MFSVYIGALHTGMKTGFTGSRSPNRMNVVSPWVSRELHTVCRLRALHCWTLSHALSRSTVTQHTMQISSRWRLCGGNLVFGLGSPIHIGSGSNGRCQSSIKNKQTNKKQLTQVQALFYSHTLPYTTTHIFYGQI